MEFGLTQYYSVEISDSTNSINSLSDGINEFVKNKEYGNSIKELFIGVICVNPKFEPFFKPRKPKYTANKKQIYKEGFNYEIERCLEYDIVIDFESFKNASNDERVKILGDEIIKSFDVIGGIKIKNKDFNIEKFRDDIEHYLKKIYS
jgi:hypothetical protein